jgi:hypothetical protein
MRKGQGKKECPPSCDSMGCSSVEEHCRRQFLFGEVEGVLFYLDAALRFIGGFQSTQYPCGRSISKTNLLE